MGSIIYNGHEIQDLIVNGNRAQLWLNGQKLYPTEEPGPGPDPYNPLGLPPFTIRAKFESGYTPSSIGDSQTLVDADENVWDITKNSTSWSLFFFNMSQWSAFPVLEILGANSTGVTSMERMFYYCASLTTISLFDTSSCTDMSSMFYNCSSLTTVPLFDTRSCTDMSSMFYLCRNVQSGALALYQQASTQTNVPSHTKTFTNCGSNTTTGAAELAKIPAGWK